ncbi:hypothetical protein Hdeb2414_s0018g00524531 [Helianthus debilis subsp. tardiflorus]
MLMESTIESQQCCVFTSSVLISLWAFLSLCLQTPPLDLLAFICSSVTSSGSLSVFSSTSHIILHILYPKHKFYGFRIKTYALQQTLPQTKTATLSVIILMNHLKG